MEKSLGKIWERKTYEFFYSDGGGGCARLEMMWRRLRLMRFFFFLGETMLS